MSVAKRIPKIKLTDEQRAVINEVRRRAEQEKPEMIAEGRRVFAADEFVAVRLQAAMSILKAVRKAKGVTLDQLAAQTGMTKPYLSKLENDASVNVTINTLYRLAEALGQDLQIAVLPKEIPVVPKKSGRRKSTAELVGKMVR